MSKRKRGRPAKPMPEKIPDSPENIAQALLFSPPKTDDEWEYLKGVNIDGAVEPSKEDKDPPTYF